MNDLALHFDAIAARITRWMARYGVLLLRISLASFDSASMRSNQGEQER